MSNSLMTEEQVKQYLGISDFRHLTRDMVVQLVSCIPDVDKEVAIKIIEQFPEFSSYAKEMVIQYRSLCDSILERNSDSVQTVMNGYKQTLDVLSKLAESEGISSEDRRYFAEKMVDVANKMAELDHGNKEFLLSLLKGFVLFTTATLLFCGSVLGINAKKTHALDQKH